MTADFRTVYHMSLYDYIFGDFSIRELWDLINNLLSTPGTNLNSSYWAIEKYSISDILLVNLQNSVVNGWQAKVADKRKGMRHLTSPTTPQERKEKKGNKKRISTEHLDRVRARKASNSDVVVNTVVNVVKEYYHIDRNKIVRKCRKNGVDCQVSDKHFDTCEDAESSLKK